MKLYTVLLECLPPKRRGVGVRGKLPQERGRTHTTFSGCIIRFARYILDANNTNTTRANTKPASRYDTGRPITKQGPNRSSRRATIALIKTSYTQRTCDTQQKAKPTQKVSRYGDNSRHENMSHSRVMNQIDGQRLIGRGTPTGTSLYLSPDYIQGNTCCTTNRFMTDDP